MRLAQAETSSTIRARENLDAREKGALRDCTSRVSPRILDVPGAAVYLSLSKSQIRAYVRAGILRPLRLPHPSGIGTVNRTVFDRADLDAFIERCKVVK